MTMHHARNKPTLGLEKATMSLRNQVGLFESKHWQVCGIL